MNTTPDTCLVITSISGPNAILKTISEGCQKIGWGFVVAGDRRSPQDFQLAGCKFLGMEEQRTLARQYGAICPENSYVRKNIAYLCAIGNGARTIIETDDDNLPQPTFWRCRQPAVQGDFVPGAGWINAYRFFCDNFIYPRGFPLDAVRSSQTDGARITTPRAACCPIQQGLVDGQPDVDAVFRLLVGEAPPFFKRPPVILDEQAWCPFNSQNTMFSKAVFPLLYLPASCTFRATDIWRGLVAQRLLWTCGWKLGFVQADVCQIRNPHNLLSDLELEIPVYLFTRRVTEMLDTLPLRSGPENLTANLVVCYENLARIGVVGSSEPGLLAAWLSDLASLGWNPTEA